MDQLIAATVVIGDRSYRIKMHPKDEETVRRTVKTINDKTIEFKTQFAGKDMQDYIGMVVLWYATQQSGSNLPAVNEITERLEKLELLLDKSLEEG